MLQKEIPILEFDDDKNVFIKPYKMIIPMEGIPKTCVLCFFSEAIEKMTKEYSYKILSNFLSEGINYPMYELDYKKKK